MKYSVDSIIQAKITVHEKMVKLSYVVMIAIILFTVVRFPVEYYRQYFHKLYDIRNKLYEHLQNWVSSFLSKS